MQAVELTWGSVSGNAFAMLAKACACLDARPKNSELSDASINACTNSLNSTANVPLSKLPNSPDHACCFVQQDSTQQMYDT